MMKMVQKVAHWTPFNNGNVKNVGDQLLQHVSYLNRNSEIQELRISSKNEAKNVLKSLIHLFTSKRKKSLKVDL